MTARKPDVVGATFGNAFEQLASSQIEQAYLAGAEAMRAECVKVCERTHVHGVTAASVITDAIRAIPVPVKP